MLLSKQCMLMFAVGNVPYNMGEVRVLAGSR